MLQLKPVSCAVRMAYSLCSLLALAAFSLPAAAQSPDIHDYVIYAGQGGPGTSTPPSPGYAVELGTGSGVSGGLIGNPVLVTSTGSAEVSSDINSGGSVSFSNNGIFGNVNAANTASLGGAILSAGSNVVFNGNLKVNGNIVIGSGSR